MICSLILGRKGSVGFPGKNLLEINGKPLAWYPMHAAKECNLIDRNFISTDDEKLKKIANENNFDIIDRPEYLATKEALGEDAYKHGYQEIKKLVKRDIELLVLLFCNAPTINTKLIELGIRKLKNNPEADSVVTVSKYNMYSPTRARKINDSGFLDPFIPFANHPNQDDINCDRDSQGDVWFADVALSIIRPKNLNNLDSGIPPQKWMGKNILPLKNIAGLDIDFEWQVGQIKWWLDNKKNETN